MKELGYSMNENIRKPIDQEVVNAADIIISFKTADELPEFVRSRIMYAIGILQIHAANRWIFIARLVIS
jgi:protein-tyrosine-phosphatase